MRSLEKLVPPPELCKQIPEGQFKNSALLWTQGVEDMFIDFRDARPEDEEGNLPAPTLPEIMDALYTEDAGTHECTLEFVTCERNRSGWEVDTSYACNANCADCAECKDVAVADTNNPAVALLKVYLKKKGIIYE